MTVCRYCTCEIQPSDREEERCEAHSTPWRCITALVARVSTANARVEELGEQLAATRERADKLQAQVNDLKARQQPIHLYFDLSGQLEPIITEAVQAEVRKWFAAENGL